MLYCEVVTAGGGDGKGRVGPRGGEGTEVREEYAILVPCLVRVRSGWLRVHLREMLGRQRSFYNLF